MTMPDTLPSLPALREAVDYVAAVDSANPGMMPGAKAYVPVLRSWLSAMEKGVTVWLDDEDHEAFLSGTRTDYWYDAFPDPVMHAKHPYILIPMPKEAPDGDA